MAHRLPRHRPHASKQQESHPADLRSRGRPVPVPLRAARRVVRGSCFPLPSFFHLRVMSLNETLWWNPSVFMTDRDSISQQHKTHAFFVTQGALPPLRRRAADLPPPPAPDPAGGDGGVQEGGERGA